MALLYAAPGSRASTCCAAPSASSARATCSIGGIRPAGMGCGPHSSDDYLWLPYATCQYVQATGDTGVLDEQVALHRRPGTGPEEEAYYDQPQRSTEVATLYEHCVRARSSTACVSAGTGCR